MFEDGKYKEYLTRPTLGFLVSKKLQDDKTTCQTGIKVKENTKGSPKLRGKGKVPLRARGLLSPKGFAPLNLKAMKKKGKKCLWGNTKNKVTKFVKDK